MEVDVPVAGMQWEAIKQIKSQAIVDERARLGTGRMTGKVSGKLLSIFWDIQRVMK